MKGDATSNSTTAATTNVSVAATETSEEQKIKVSKEQEEKESKVSKENLTKMKNFGPTKGKIELNQKHQMMMQIQSEQELNEKLDAEVLAGEKTKEVGGLVPAPPPTSSSFIFNSDVMPGQKVPA